MMTYWYAGWSSSVGTLSKFMVISAILVADGN